MAKKRKSRQQKTTAGHSVTTRSDNPLSASQPKQKSYGGKYLTLAIMGGAAFFGLKSCGDEGSADTDGDGVYYSTVSDCINDGNSASVCADGWNNAKANFYANVPANMSQESCQSLYLNCYFDSVDRSWNPVISGFLLSRSIRNERDEQYVYSSGGSSYVSRPAWRVASGNYVWDGKRNATTYRDTSHRAIAPRVPTESRGGFGRFFSSHGSWGG
ncbi:hypothetical protein CJP72_20445 [Citrobacter sp. NCU1]|uniref:DUF1190 domain-containing protein n=1 Tax=Citrobacter sp. NCU1 TaxID=2026683 RepID=UPI001391E02F|nr:DUF1190 domain-containing protein [Citrobacter sp. NCU1]NDO83046.1 hypothetical protein [Citrobacter sp. NCU1]